MFFVNERRINRFWMVKIFLVLGPNEGRFPPAVSWLGKARVRYPGRQAGYPQCGEKICTAKSPFGRAGAALQGCTHTAKRARRNDRGGFPPNIKLMRGETFPPAPPPALAVAGGISIKTSLLQIRNLRRFRRYRRCAGLLLPPRRVRWLVALIARRPAVWRRRPAGRSPA